MKCEVCKLGIESGKTCGPICEGLLVLAGCQREGEEWEPEICAEAWERVLRMDPNEDPENPTPMPEWFNPPADERRQLAWDYRRRWHEVRGLAFTEEPPKPGAVQELERQDLLKRANA